METNAEEVEAPVSTTDSNTSEWNEYEEFVSVAESRSSESDAEIPSSNADLPNMNPEEDEEITAQTFRVGPARPKIIRNARPSKPKKQYNMINSIKSQLDQNPSTVKKDPRWLDANEWKNKEIYVDKE